MPLPYEISDMCKKCIIKHKKNKKEFKVTCVPIPKEMEDDKDPVYPLEKLLGKETYLQLPENVKIDLQLEKNTLLWAKECLGWTPYNKARNFFQWYQKEFLLCNAQNKVLRFGRRLGKTEGMCVEILHRGWTNNSSDKPILIIGPFQNLIDEIFDRLDSLLSGNDSIYRGKFSRKRQPSEITLSNGIKIKGFTTGTDGNSIRGQSAQAVYLDECAYIPQEAFKAVMAFKLDNPNVIFRAASTPSMVETNFKTWCNEDKAWKDFWCPSTILPNFKEKDEPELRASLTADGYKLEVEAQFIEGSARVFKSHNINNAKEKYRYINYRSELENPNDWYITIGCDWNEQRSGVQIVVLGFNYRSGGKKPFKVLNRISMHGDYSGIRTKNLQTAGVEKIKELHEAFKADYVYVDQGHGSMQTEVLSEYFFKRNEILKFKAVDFASNYEMEDIYTGEIRHKRRKVMMVYFLQKRFELEEIIISELEEQGKSSMIDQLMLYNIVRYDSKGQPIFEGEDHILDALMLATFAFIENYDSIFDKKTGSFVAGFTNKLSRFKDEFNTVRKEAPLTPTEIYMNKEHNINFLEDHTSLYNIEHNIKKVQGVSSLSKRKRVRRGGFDFDIF